MRGNGIKEREERIKEIEQILPKWEKYHYGKILKLEIKSLHREIENILGREQDMKDNPEAWGG